MFDGNGNKTTKFCPNKPGGRARLSFLFFYFSFLLFILFILLIQFNFVLTTYVRFLKTPASTRRLPESTSRPVRSGPVSRSNGAAQCAIVRSIRSRTNSHDLDGYGRSKKPKHARAKSAKRSKKSKKIQKNERKPLWTLAVTSHRQPKRWSSQQI